MNKHIDVDTKIGVKMNFERRGMSFNNNMLHFVRNPHCIAHRPWPATDTTKDTEKDSDVVDALDVHPFFVRVYVDGVERAAKMLYMPIEYDVHYRYRKPYAIPPSHSQGGANNMNNGGGFALAGGQLPYGHNQGGGRPGPG